MKTTKKTKAGLKIYVDGKHIKTVPEKYEAFIHDIDFSGSKRLLPGERFILEYAYFLSILKNEEKYVYELIENAYPEYSQEIKNHIGEIRFELVFDNKVRLKINKELYLLCPKKEELKHSNF